MAPPSTQPGDLIFLVFGRKGPCVLRPRKTGDGYDRYQLVGELYVHGIMDGEALDSAPKEETICLF